MERGAEINQLKQELSNLQRRYALYRRIARILRTIFIVLMPISAIVALAIATKLFLFDVLNGVLFVAALLIFVPATVWLIRRSEIRWIDLAAPQLRGIYHPDFFTPDRSSHRRIRSDAELTELQIADREQRLSELGENVPGFHQNR